MIDLDQSPHAIAAGFCKLAPDVSPRKAHRLYMERVADRVVEELVNDHLQITSDGGYRYYPDQHISLTLEDDAAVSDRWLKFGSYTGSSAIGCRQVHWYAKVMARVYRGREVELRLDVRED